MSACLRGWPTSLLVIFNIFLSQVICYLLTRGSVTANQRRAWGGVWPMRGWRSVRSPPVTQKSTWENILIWKIGLSILPETEIELNKIFMKVVYTIFSPRLPYSRTHDKSYLSAASYSIEKSSNTIKRYSSNYSSWKMERCMLLRFFNKLWNPLRADVSLRLRGLCIIN